VPPNPGAWLTTTGARKAIDRLRRESKRDAKHQAALMVHDDTPPEPTGPVEDDRLRLVFTCCHPALAPEARVALTLRLIGGLTVADIARAFLVAPREGQDQAGEDPLPGARPRGPARPGHHGAHGRVPDLQ
jgi:RNA polymerase sigma-70 factor (ECF subfamily)